MTDKLKKEIKEAFEIDSPVGKKQFLKDFHYPKLNKTDFILEQIFYIRKKTWLFSVLIMGFIFWFLHFYENSSTPNMNLWIISSLMPFLALIFTVELSRSSMFKMEEMEAGCLFGLSQIFLARMLIMGIWNGILLFIIALTANLYLPEGMIKIFLYLLAPYLLVNGLSFYFINNKRERGEIYSCAAIAVMVSICGMIMPRFLKRYSENIGTWVMSVVWITGLFMVLTQLRKMHKKLEEDRWNFA